jgi:hypothetical protein
MTLAGMEPKGSSGMHTACRKCRHEERFADLGALKSSFIFAKLKWARHSPHMLSSESSLAKEVLPIYSLGIWLVYISDLPFLTQNGTDFSLVLSQNCMTSLNGPYLVPQGSKANTTMHCLLPWYLTLRFCMQHNEFRPNSKVGKARLDVRKWGKSIQYTAYGEYSVKNSLNTSYRPVFIDFQCSWQSCVRVGTVYLLTKGLLLDSLLCCVKDLIHWSRSQQLPVVTQNHHKHPGTLPKAVGMHLKTILEGNWTVRGNTWGALPENNGSSCYWAASVAHLCQIVPVPVPILEIFWYWPII